MKLSQWLKFSPAKLIQLLRGNALGQDQDNFQLHDIGARGYISEAEKHSFIGDDIKTPTPTKSNVCDCEDIDDFKMKVIETKTIQDALVDATFFGDIGVVAENTTCGKVTNTIVVMVAGKCITVNIKYASNILFEEIKCASCGTYIGWCTEIGGRAFSVTPRAYIHGLISKEIVKHVENENEKARLKFLDAQMMEAKRNHHINSFKYKNII